MTRAWRWSTVLHSSGEADYFPPADGMMGMGGCGDHEVILLETTSEDEMMHPQLISSCFSEESANRYFQVLAGVGGAVVQEQGRVMVILRRWDSRF